MKESRSFYRRKAGQKGEPMPEFDKEKEARQIIVDTLDIDPRMAQRVLNKLRKLDYTVKFSPKDLTGLILPLLK